MPKTGTDRTSAESVYGSALYWLRQARKNCEALRLTPDVETLLIMASVLYRRRQIETFTNQTK